MPCCFKISTVKDHRTASSYDSVAQRYAEEIADELPHKPIDRAWLACLAELAAGGVIADVGCGPGHVAAHLAGLGARTVGIDLSPGMVEVARKRHPELAFEVGSLLALPAGDNAWSGAVCAYSIIHLDPPERPAAFRELARAIAPGGWLLLSFHISGEGYQAGQTAHLGQWWGHEVDLNFHYLSPQTIGEEVRAAGFVVMSVTQRRPWPAVEAETERCHLLAQRSLS
jgi:ubiquinone/menaquinone biosynthesis C-methylase UbiE